MPPVRKYAGPLMPGKRSAYVPGTRRNRRKFKFKKGTKIGTTGRGKSSSLNVIKLTTYSRKAENLSIEYREQLDMTSMGYDAGSSPFLMRVNLNNPVVGGATQASGNRIIGVVGSLKSGSTNPIFSRSSLDQNKNLQPRLQEYYDEYRSAIVTSSEVTVSIRPKLNQVNPGAPSLVPYFTNDATGLDPAGQAGLRGPTQQTRWIGGNATGDLLAWMVRQNAQQQLYDNANGVVPLSTLKEGIPGVRMTKLNITPNSTKGVTFKMKYTPKTQFQIADWKDNKQFFNTVVSDQLPEGFKEAYCYVGIGAQPDGEDISGDAGKKVMANCIVEIRARYNIHFSERKNEEGNNEPVVHADEL
jgi:hypothetical protein